MFLRTFEKFRKHCQINMRQLFGPDLELGLIAG